MVRRPPKPSSWPVRPSSVGELARLDEATLTAALQETPVAQLAPGSPDGIVDLLVATGLSASRGAARRTIGEGSLGEQRPRRQRGMVAAAGDFLHGRWLVVRRGKAQRGRRPTSPGWLARTRAASPTGQAPREVDLEGAEIPLLAADLTPSFTSRNLVHVAATRPDPVSATSPRNRRDSPSDSGHLICPHCRCAAFSRGLTARPGGACCLRTQ